ncbi:MAG: hypothetical protein K2K77_01150, partial [Duncaniella sp.]|nr:hypothetical protein [Duncaniella sp.]
NRTGQLAELPPLYEYIITAIPSEKRLNMMLRAKLRSLSANTTANQDQDKHQADFVDITNKYGNLIAQEFLSNHPELATILDLGATATATKLLARLAMLSVSAQQDIIDELISAYQNLEEELRRINQWDLEREYRDFEAEFVREELFSSSIDDTVLGGASMLTTFRCRHRTFPHDSKAIINDIQRANSAYGRKLIESQQLNKEISSFYRAAYRKIATKLSDRKKSLWDATLAILMKYDCDAETANNFLFIAQQQGDEWITVVRNTLCNHPKAERIISKLQSYSADFLDLEERSSKERKQVIEQRKRLMHILSLTAIGQGYADISSVMPVEGNIPRVMAVLKEVRFGKTDKDRFLPGKIQFVFALSAGNKELVLNLVDKGKSNNYARLDSLLQLPVWNFNPDMWDKEISKYNNRVIERKIITGNILGAYAHPLIQDIKPHFITFTLCPHKNANSVTERGLLLPMSANNVEKRLSDVALPITEGLRYAGSTNHVYTISGIGVDFSISPIMKNGYDLTFYI